MLVPIGGVGMTWLGYAYFIQVVAPPDIDFPIVPIIPFFILWVSFFGNTSTLTGPIPSVLAACITGTQPPNPPHTPPQIPGPPS